MSRAFVREDDAVDELPDRPISGNDNFVTASGLAAIESALSTAKRAYGKAQALADRDALAAAGRELRYWSLRRSTARLVTPSGNDHVKFGHAVTFVRDDGRRSTFRIVGEDEAHPSKGLVSYVSPVARALLGAAVGDAVRIGAGGAEIVAIE